MPIPEKYDEKMKQLWGMHAVWFPGTRFRVGDIVQRAKDGTYQKIGSLKEMGIAVKSTSSEALKTGFKSTTTKVTIFQGGGEVTQSQVNASANAEVEFSFTKGESFSVATPVGKVDTLENLLGIGAKITALPTFDHNDWRIVRQVLTVKGFTVLGSETRGSSIRFGGKGKAVIDFINFGLSAGIKKTSNSTVDVEFVGQSGALGMDLAKVKKNGAVVMG